MTKPKHISRQLIRKRDAAKMLGVSFHTLGRIIERGDIGVVKYPTGTTVIPIEEIERYMDENYQPTFAERMKKAMKA